MDTNQLAGYVAERIRAGAAKAVIFDELLSLGWSEEEVDTAYRAGLVAYGAPVPSEGNRGAGKKASTVDTVINFFSFILLTIIATALGMLLFQVINKYFPDPLNLAWDTDASFASTIHYAMAALVIGFPLYYVALWMWFRHFRTDEGRTESTLSKWLTYLVLLVTAVTIVGDLITTLYTLLQGEITVRFFLKAFTILIIAGIIFGFYYLERRKVQYHLDIPRSWFLIFGRVVAGLIGVAVVLGFIAGGSPTTERLRAFDRMRAENLNFLSSCIQSYASTLGQLPQSLGDLSASSQFSYCGGALLDPETKVPYSYRIVTPSKTMGAALVGSFELCATFAYASSEKETGGIGMGGITLWDQHSAGKSCDTATAQLLVPTPPLQLPLDTTSVPLKK
jgi:hypothetical protein